MTKTQKKAQAYIIDCIDPDVYEVKATTDKEKLQFLHDVWKQEKQWEIDKIGNQEALISWYQGLPSVFGAVFTNHDILELAREWGTLEKDASEAKEYRYINNYWRMLASNTLQLFDKHNIK